MTSLKAITVLLGAGLLLSLSLSLSFSTFGTEEAFILLAALFACDRGLHRLDHTPPS